MKVIFLNVWQARLASTLQVFIEEQAPTTDVFCFQEADTNPPDLLSQWLPEFHLYATHTKVFDEQRSITLKTYVKKSVRVLNTSVLMPSELDRGMALIVSLEVEGAKLGIINVHGIAYHPDNKLDTPGRLAQTDTIIAHCQQLGYPIIVGGDFNLLPNTESVKRFSSAGFHNLVGQYHIPTTRDHFAWDRFADNKQNYADYVFVGDGIPVKDFSVPTHDAASDHLPLILELDVVPIAQTIEM